MKKFVHFKKSDGFTLVEMLTVVGIIAILIALVTPALVDVIRSTRLNSAGDGLTNRLSLAQQSAVSLSSEVEVRFYKYVDSNSDLPNQASYYAYQVVQSLANGTEKAISDPYYLESGVVISDQSELSPLLETANPQFESTGGKYLFTPPGSASSSDVTYASMRFYPDGSVRMLTAGTNADASSEDKALAYTIPDYDKSYVTIVESRNASNTQIPSNYYCIQIDSYTGKTRVYRP